MIGVLGEVRIISAGGPVSGDCRALRLERKARELLTVLALQAPAALGVQELARLLWDDPPVSAAKTLRAHLSRIGAAVRLTGEAELQSRSGHSYRLIGATDVSTVQNLRSRARRLPNDQPDAAADLFGQARDLWLGAPELPATAAAEALRLGWQRDQRQLISEHLAALARGSHPEAAIGELVTLTNTDPLDEPAWVSLVIALHRAARQSEALQAAARARRALIGVGLDPGPELARAQADVLGAPEPAVPDPAGHRAEPPRYTADGSTAFLAWAAPKTAKPDLLLLNPGLVTIDGLHDEPHVLQAHALLGDVGRLICLDRRGIGLSAPLAAEPSPLQQWTEDVEAVRLAAGLPAPVLIANFDTGLVAIDYAARHPQHVAALVLINCFASYQRRDGYPYGPDQTNTHDLIEAAVDPSARAPLRTAALVALVAPSLADDQAFSSWWDRIGRRGANPAIARVVRAAGTGLDLRDRLEQVSVPVLVLHRRWCTNVEAGHSRYLAERLRSSRLVLLDGADAVWFSAPRGRRADGRSTRRRASPAPA